MTLTSRSGEARTGSTRIPGRPRMLPLVPPEELPTPSLVPGMPSGKMTMNSEGVESGRGKSSDSVRAFSASTVALRAAVWIAIAACC